MPEALSDKFWQSDFQWPDGMLGIQ